jgi:Protein of unknown function (DUF551)
MQMKRCPSCNKEQQWDELWGFANQLCPEFCSFTFTEILPMSIEDCWIDVDDKLPEDRKEVLYFAINPMGGKEIMTGHRENGKWTHCCLWYSTQILNDDVAVTHWMPLPDYPITE